MTLTVDHRETTVARINNEPDFARALLGEAVSLFLNGEVTVARLLMLDFAQGLLRFEALALVELVDASPHAPTTMQIAAIQRVAGLQ